MITQINEVELLYFHYLINKNNTILIQTGLKNALYQKLQPQEGSSFLIERYTSPYFESPWHFHEEFELVYCEQGFGKKFIGSVCSEYEEGDLYLLGSNLPHWFKADDSFYESIHSKKPCSLVIQFREQFLGKEFFLSPEMNEMKHILDYSSRGLVIRGDHKNTIATIMQSMIHQNKFEKLSSLIYIFELLSKKTELRPLLLEHSEKLNNKDLNKMSAVMEFTLQNYLEDIKVIEAANLLGYTEAAFCRYFKFRTRTSYMEFVNRLRLDHACDLLSKTNQTVLEICFNSGFRNLSNFNRQFRKYFGKNPKTFRKMET